MSRMLASHALWCAWGRSTRADVEAGEHHMIMERVMVYLLSDSPAVRRGERSLTVGVSCPRLLHQAAVHQEQADCITQ